MNPGKRKRFLVHEDIISESAIEATLEKILGGDARFKNIKDNGSYFGVPAMKQKF